MKMNSGNQSKDRWEKIAIDRNLVENSVKLAERDIKTSRDVFNNKDYDWSFSIAYNSMLQAGRALMFLEGFRPKGGYRHVLVIEFAKKRFGKDFEEKVLFMFNKIRKKRHVAVYEQVNIISEDESRNALE